MVGPRPPFFFMPKAIKAKPSQWDTESHSHYSAEVKSALEEHLAYAFEYETEKKYNLYENMRQLNQLQSSFNKLIRLRREETGHGAYLSEEEYMKVVKQKK